MLSRVAENIYWMARCLERSENSARLINSTTHLLLDLPRGVEIGWRKLVATTGNQGHYTTTYGKRGEERAVMRFLITDLRNPGALLTSIANARENARVSREVIPQEAWEQVNALYLYVRDQAKTSLGRKGRYDLLREIIARCQTITGALAGTMNQGAGYQFVRVGRNLERADMTTRILDAGATGLLSGRAGDHAAYSAVRWMSVLKSLSAYESYRYQGHIGVRGTDVVSYLLLQRLFPRSVAHTLEEVSACLNRLPNPEVPQQVVLQLQGQLQATDPKTLTAAQIRTLVDQIQQGLGQLHNALTVTYFRINLAA